MPSGTRKSVYPRQTPYANFQKAQRMKMSRRLKGISRAKRGNTKTCSLKQTLRKAYVRYTKSGKHKLIKASCITKRGLSKNPQRVRIGPLRKGELTQFGYEKVQTLSLRTRHKALAKAVKKYGSLSVWKKINVLYVYNKYTNPALSTLYNADKNWIKNTYGLKGKK